MSARHRFPPASRGGRVACRLQSSPYFPPWLLLPSFHVLASLSVEVAVGCAPFADARFSNQMLASVIRWVKGIVDKDPLVSIIAVADVPGGSSTSDHGRSEGINLDNGAVVAGLPTTDCLVVAVTTPVGIDYRPDGDLLLERCESLLA